jgi:AcrR family transcriptional regulator
MRGSGWLQNERGEFVAERILDGASILFADRGVSSVSMADVAKAVGCSRQTLYRYFEDRDALRMAYVNREARRMGNAIAHEIAWTADQGEGITDAIMLAIGRVRADPELSAWFQPEQTGITAGLAQASVVIESLVAGFLGDSGDPDVRLAAQWVVRGIVSLLSVPGESEEEERAFVGRFLIPPVTMPVLRSSQSGEVVAHFSQG